MDGLETPFALGQLASEPIEKLGMRRVIAHRAKVVAGCDDSNAEVMLPESIDDDAGGERMIGPGQPAGERGAAAADGRLSAILAVDLVGAEKLGKAGSDGFFRLAIVAGVKHVRFGRGTGAVAYGH